MLPASAIKVFIPSDSLVANEMMTLTVTVDTGQVASSEYQGNLFINYSSGQMSVPFTVKVKDNWYIPLVTLVFGIGLAMSITYYRTKVKPRDEVIVRAGQLQAQMKKDNELAEPFKKAIAAAMVDVEAALQTQKWEDAQTSMNKADACWNRWRRYRRDWLEQPTYYAALIVSLEKADNESNIPFVQTIKRAVTDSNRTVAEMETPDPLRQTLETSGQQLDRYNVLTAQIDEIGQKAGELDQAGGAKWKKQAVSWKNQLNELTPGALPFSR